MASQLATLGFATHSNPVTVSLVKSTVPTPAEYKMNLEKRLSIMQGFADNCADGSEEKTSFENDCERLREQIKNVVSEDVIRARCERLAKLRADTGIGLSIVDNRQQYQTQTDRAVAALCGGAV